MYWKNDMDTEITIFTIDLAPERFQPLFALGALVATPAALETLNAHVIKFEDLLLRHVSGDWGNLEGDDQALNRQALEDGSRILSSYVLAPEVKVWIITEADRSVTTLLLPEEY